jgi:type IV pilus assembly protein PilB
VVAANEMIAALTGSSRQQLGMMLLQRGLLTPGQLVEVLLEQQETGARLGSVIAGRGWISQTELARVLAEQHELEYFDLGAEPPSHEAAALLPEASAREHRAVPVRILEDETLLAAVADPTDLPDLAPHARRPVQFAVSAASDVDRALDRLYSAPIVQADAEDARDEPSSAPEPPFMDESPVGDDLEPESEEPAETAPQAYEAPAAEEPSGAGRPEPWAFETYGLPEDEPGPEPGPAIAEALAEPPAEPVALDPERELDPVVQITETPPAAEAVEAETPAVEAEPVHALTELGLAPDAIPIVQSAVDQPHGLVLAVGPARSGRTTTLRTALDVLHGNDRDVVVIEGKASQGKALRTALQSAPGVLLIEDVEQPGTARAAVEAALRGHLVLSTLHAPTFGSALARLTAMGIERQVLAATLSTVVGQRLARRLCPHCREPYEAGRSSLIAAGFGDTYLPVSPYVGVYRANGCDECKDGYKGRIGIFEVLAVSAPMRRILETGSAADVDGAAAYGGTRTLLADGLRHCLAGETTLDEVRRVVGTRPV